MSAAEQTIKIKLELEGIDEIRRFHVEPGDVLVFRASKNATAQEMSAISHSVKEKLPDVTVIVLSSNLEFAGLINIEQHIRAVTP